VPVLILRICLPWPLAALAAVAGVGNIRLMWSRVTTVTTTIVIADIDEIWPFSDVSRLALVLSASL
jgi:hypothetical protein